MTPVEPALHDGARLVVFAKDQPEYIPLPASVDANGVVMTEWEPTAEELSRLLSGGRIRLWVHTFGHPLQPLSIEAIEPECGMRSVDVKLCSCTVVTGGHVVHCPGCPMHEPRP